MDCGTQASEDYDFIALLLYLLFCSLPVRAVTDSPAKHRTYASTSEQHEHI
jgi:hypothetical protein